MRKTSSLDFFEKNCYPKPKQDSDSFLFSYLENQINVNSPKHKHDNPWITAD